ncbi:MAG: ATP:Cob(I)alamin adenosyltransferase, partial [uncultured Pseudonocardia sp.]
GRAPHQDLHEDRRRRNDGARGHEPGPQDRRPTRGLRRHGRGERCDRRRRDGRRARRRRPRAARAGPERPVRRGRGPVHTDRARPGVPAAARHRGLRDAAGGLVRRVQLRAAQARLVHPARGHPRGGAPARRPHGDPARRALGLGTAGGRRRADQPADGALPQPVVGPAVHPRPGGQPRRRRPLAPRLPL